MVELAIWSIGNISAGSIEMRDHILSYHPISILANLLDKAIPDSSFIKNTTWCFSTLCRY